MARVLALLSGVAAVLFTAAGAAAVPSGSNGRIVFVHFIRGRFTMLQTMRPGGNDVRDLQGGTSLSGPAWSPDGRRVAAGAESGGPLVVLQAGVRRRLATTLLVAVDPAWAPEGNRLAVSGVRPGQTVSQIYSVRVRNGAVTSLTDGPEYKYNPDWSPDGARIAYAVGDERVTDDIVILDVRSGRTTTLSALGHDNYPAWSPDGRQLAYVSDRDGTTNVWVMSADGSRQRKLTNVAPPVVRVDGPRWSPDGGQIVYSRQVGGTVELVVVSANATGEKVIFSREGEEGLEPDWQRVLDLGVKQSARRRGGVVSLIARVRNSSPGPASGVTIVDRLAGDVRVLTTNRRCSGRRVIACTLPVIPPGASVSVTLRLQVHGSLVSTVALRTPVVDPRPGNNTSRLRLR